MANSDEEEDRALDSALRMAFAVGRATAFSDAQGVVRECTRAQALGKLERLAWEAVHASTVVREKEEA